MPRGKKRPHPAKSTAVASSPTNVTTSGQTASNSESESDSESDVENPVSQDPPSTAPTPTPRNRAQSVKKSHQMDATSTQDSEASTEPTMKKRKTTSEVWLHFKEHGSGELTYLNSDFLLLYSH
jgi:hypothetical protein